MTTLSSRAGVVVIGNEKGGSGKSTTAMHLIVALLRSGLAVASVDLDARQGTLTRYLGNRRAYAEAHGVALPMPAHEAIGPGADRAGAEARLAAVIERLTASSDAVVVDTPGGDDPLTRAGHSFADVLITPLNDSFVDLDVIARVDGETRRVVGPSHYAEMVWQQRIQKVQRDGRAFDWIVLRNRLSSLDALNKRDMARALAEMSGRFGFRLLDGFGERVIFRELFLMGLTMMDLREVGDSGALTLSQVAARQEVRTLVDALVGALGRYRPPALSAAV